MPFEHAQALPLSASHNRSSVRSRLAETMRRPSGAKAVALTESCPSSSPRRHFAAIGVPQPQHAVAVGRDDVPAVGAKAQALTETEPKRSHLLQVRESTTRHSLPSASHSRSMLSRLA